MKKQRVISKIGINAGGLKGLILEGREDVAKDNKITEDGFKLTKKHPINRELEDKLNDFRYFALEICGLITKNTRKDEQYMLIEGCEVLSLEFERGITGYFKIKVSSRVFDVKSITLTTPKTDSSDGYEWFDKVMEAIEDLLVEVEQYEKGLKQISDEDLMISYIRHGKDKGMDLDKLNGMSAEEKADYCQSILEKLGCLVIRPDEVYEEVETEEVSLETKPLLLEMSESNENEEDIFSDVDVTPLEVKETVKLKKINMIHNLFPNEVYLEPNEHKYFDSEGNQYISFSALYGKLVKKFDAVGISKLVSKSNGQSASEIRQGWEQTAVNGSRVDAALERYAQTATLEEGDEDLLGCVKEVLYKYRNYSKTFEQGIPYSKKYRVAGSWDKLSLTSNRKDSKFVLSDFKCFAKGYDSLFTVSGQPFLNAPLEHLPNTKFTKISLQLSYYSYLFEELTGRKCEKVFIDLITPVFDSNHKLLSYKNEVVPTIYLKNDIKIFLETFQEDIKDMLDNTVKAEFVDVSAEDEEIF